MIELRGVSKTVPSGAGSLTILHPLDLTIDAGRVVAITGPSGSGKSTLLGLLAGLDAPSSGSIILDGVDITAQLTPTSAGWATTGTNAHIGVRADDAGSDHNHNGSIDDTAVWLNRALTVPEAQGLYQAAFIPEPGSISLLLGSAALVGGRRRRP